MFDYLLTLIIIFFVKLIINFTHVLRLLRIFIHLQTCTFVEIYIIFMMKCLIIITKEFYLFSYTLRLGINYHTSSTSLREILIHNNYNY